MRLVPLLGGLGTFLPFPTYAARGEDRLRTILWTPRTPGTSPLGEAVHSQAAGGSRGPGPRQGQTPVGGPSGPGPAPSPCGPRPLGLSGSSDQAGHWVWSASRGAPRVLVGGVCRGGWWALPPRGPGRGRSEAVAQWAGARAGPPASQERVPSRSPATLAGAIHVEAGWAGGAGSREGAKRAAALRAAPGAGGAGGGSLGASSRCSSIVGAGAAQTLTLVPPLLGMSWPNPVSSSSAAARWTWGRGRSQGRAG